MTHEGRTNSDKNRIECRAEKVLNVIMCNRNIDFEILCEDACKVKNNYEKRNSF